MNKKTIGIGLTLFALFAVGLAFGQVCLTKDAVKITAKQYGKVTIKNMVNEPVDVIVTYTYAKGNSQKSASLQCRLKAQTQQAFMGEEFTITDMGSYSDHEVWTCVVR